MQLRNLSIILGLMFFSCSQHLYYNQMIGIHSKEKKADIVSLTQIDLMKNNEGLLTGYFISNNSKDPIPFTFFLTSETDTSKIETNKDGIFSFISRKNSTFKIYIRYVGYEASIVDSIPVSLGKETKIVIRLKEQHIFD